jgi:hypothetical protein
MRVGDAGHASASALAIQTNRQEPACLAVRYLVVPSWTLTAAESAECTYTRSKQMFQLCEKVGVP